MSDTPKPALPMARWSCFCTAGPTTSMLSSMSRHCGHRPATASSCHICAATARRAFSPPNVRNGQPAALASDIVALMDALKIQQATIGGFDWSARTANIVAALWPQRCKAMVSVSGYLIGSQAAGRMPLPPQAELQWWYQYYLATDRGAAGYDKYRHDFSKLIWRIASRNKISTMPRSIAARRSSTIPIMSRSSFITIAGGSISPRAGRDMTTWKSGSPKPLLSRCRPSR